MNMRFFLVVALAAACCLPASGQDFDRYQTLLPQGIVPKDFTDRSTDKFTQELNSMSTTGKRRDRQNRKKFYLESTFSVDEFLGSGNVLFNDEVSMYLSCVLAEIVKPYPELQSKVRVYAVKSAMANAFTTNNGIIFVNLGLLARLDNEAQLAFILAHEVVHYQKKHVINKYVTNIEIERARGDYHKLSRESKGFAKSSYSKELESEADLGGADIYAQTGYSKDTVHKVFDILNLADFPLSWAPFDYHNLESSRYQFPDSLYSKTVSAVQADENYNDTLRSHPNIRKRKEAIAGRFSKGGKGDYYKVSRSWFDKSRKIARFELCRSYLLEHRYVEALILAQNLQRQDPGSVYLRETMAKALYGLGKDHIRFSTQRKEESWAGEPARLLGFFNRLDGFEVAVAAICQLYRVHEAAPGNEEIRLMLHDLIRTLSAEEKDLEKRFLRSAADKPMTDLDHPYTQYAFLDFKNTGAFFDMFDKQVAAGKKQPKVVKTRHARRAERNKPRKPLNVTKVVVVNPMYKKLNVRKREKVRYAEAEEVLVNIDDEIRLVAGKVGMKVDVVNPNTVSSSKVGIMQANSILNDWFEEQVRFDENERVSPVYNEVAALAETYKTEHFLWMGTLTVTHKPMGRGFLIAGSFFPPAIAPLYATLFVLSRGTTLYFGLVLNVRTQAVELVDLRQMQMRDTRYLLQSNMYNTLLKLKKARQ